MSLSKEKMVDLYRIMVEARRFEEEVVNLFYAGKIPGFLHSSIGEEAIAAGVSAALEPQDQIFIHHRGHSYCIAKGLSMERMMAELFGKKTGYCKGKGGSMHLADFELNLMGANGIVGGSIPISTGVALYNKLKKRNAVTVCCFGDGASNQGTFHESLNLAAIWKLPLIFFCENNLYAMCTPQSSHQSIRDISIRAQGYGMAGITIDGNDVVTVYETIKKALDSAREGNGPTLIEAKTYRHRGHWEGDPDFSNELYRPRAEIEEWKLKDPIKTFEKKLITRGLISKKEIELVNSEALRKIKEAVEFADNSQDPDLEEALTDIYTN